jgi:antitoxin (DNA-binding transcriptional repressor) of toxin-antitoxin stability system
MKIQNIREVKTRFSRYVKELPKSGSVLITQNRRPCAALVPVTEDTDLEALALSQNKRFWRFDRRGDRARKTRGVRRFSGPLKAMRRQRGGNLDRSHP